MLLLFAFAAYADEGPADTQGDFFSPTRTDAPTDGILLLDATFALDADVVEGPGAPFSLSGTVLMSYTSGNETIVSFAPPSGGWQAAGDYVVQVPIQGYDADDVPAELVFTVGADPAPAPVPPTVTDASAADWSPEEVEHMWGCCDHTRVVSFEVESNDADPWARVELTGLFEGETQMAEDPVLQRLDVGIGPGTHTLTYTQWEDDGVLQPSAFEVAAVSASGERSTAEVFGLSDEAAPPSSERSSAGVCGTAGVVGLSPALVALLLLRRRQR